MSKILKISSAVFLLFFTVFVYEANAEACGNRNLIGNRDIFWGDPPPLGSYNNPPPKPYTDVTAVPGDTVRLSGEGELPGGSSSCLGRAVTFEVYRDGSLAKVTTVSGSLQQGAEIVPMNLGTYQWYVEWPHILFDGRYRLKMVSYDGFPVNSYLSTNVLIITGAGASPPLPSCSANFSPNSIVQGQSSTLSWTSSDDDDGNLQYNCSGNIGSGSTTSSGSVSVNPGSSQTCTFTAANAGGSATCSASVTVSAPPPAVASITCNGVQNQCSISYGGSATINWTGTNVTSCSVSPTGWTGISGSENTGSLTNTQTYTVNCSGASGSTSASVQVAVASAPLASCTTSFTPTSIMSGSSSTQTWTSLNDADNSLSYSCTGDLGSGNLAANGSRTVSPSQSQNCTLTAVNLAGTSSICSASIAVNQPAPPPLPPPAPTAAIFCNGTAGSCDITAGSTVTISWNCTNSNGTVSDGSGNLIWSGTSGSQTVTVSSSVNYVLTCSGSGGTATAIVVVTALQPPPPPQPPPPAPQSNFMGLEIPNPFSGNLNTFDKLFDNITLFLYYLAAPIVIIMIILAGILFLLGRGQPDKVQTAKKILTYAILGLVIILIGRGFIALLENIFALGGQQ